MLAGLLLPPVIVLGVVWMRQLLQADELQQRVELLAMATTCIVILCAVFVLMLIHDMHIMWHVPASALLWLIIGSNVLTRAWLRYRYR